MKKLVSIAAVALTLFGAMAYIPAGMGDGADPVPSFCCALRVGPDGGLYSTTVNFMTPPVRADASRVNSGRSPYCDIINNSGRIIPDETVRSLDENFTLYIWPNDTASFGTPSYPKIKLYIITFDGMGGVAGYFSSGTPDSIFLDYDDLALDLDVTAHELQHLIHNDKDPWETIWVNEGCSEAAIYECYGGGNPGLTLHFGSFSTNTDNDFTNWNTVSDYGGAGLWTIYNLEHFGGRNFTKALVADQSRGMASYDKQLAPFGESWNSIFKRWVAANWLNNHSVDNGEWGYTGVWNYVGHTLLEKNYPATCSSAVSEAWSADYIRFEPTIWNRLQGDIQINVTFTSGTPYCAVAAVGKPGTPNPDRVIVPVISGNRATALVPNLGGDFSVTCLAISGLGGSCNYTYEASIVDLTAPNTTLSVTPTKPNGKDGWYVTRPSLGLSASELNYTSYYHWDDGTDIKYTGKFSVPDGEHLLHYHSIDGAGNIEVGRTRAFKVDLTPPNTTAGFDPSRPDGNNGWYLSAANISLSCDTPGANISWSWDDRPFSSFNSSVRIIEGIHRFNFHAEDAAGNIEVLRTVETRLDTEPPAVNATMKPAVPDGLNGWYVRTPTLNLSSDEAHHPVIFYRWDDGNLSPYKGDLKPPAGEHAIAFFAVDEGGNNGTQYSLRTKVDTVAPVARIKGEPLEPGGLDGWFNAPVVINFSTNETGNVTFRYRWDENPEQAATGPLEAPEGAHMLTYYAIDEAGNTGNERTTQFKVDTAAPATVLSISPEDIGKGWFHFHPKVNLSTEPASTVQYSLDGGPLVKYIRSFEIGEGAHNLTFFASDQAGNWEKRQSRIFKVDTLVPVLWVNLSMDNFTTVQNVTVTAAGEDQNGVQDYIFDFGDGEVASWTNLSTATHVYPLPGTYTVTVRVRDLSGLMTIAQPITVTVRLPPKPPPATPTDSLRAFISSIPVFVYYLMAIALVAAMAGGVAGHVARKKRRARLYIDVEKAEAERERRHTMEIHDDDPLGLPRSRTVPASSAAPNYSPAASAGTENSGQGPSSGAPALIDWTPDHPVMDDAPAAETFAVQPEEIVYETEVNAPVPIWAQGARQKPAPVPRQPAAARQPQAAQTGSRRAEPDNTGGTPADDPGIQDILKAIEHVKGKRR